jgi:HEAT repeat protein
MQLVALQALGVSGCTAPGPDPDFASSDPRERSLAAIKAAANEDRSAILPLIAMLESEDDVARLVAITALEDITGETLGYEFVGAPAERRAAIDRWVGWAVAEGLVSSERVGQRSSGGGGDAGSR